MRILITGMTNLQSGHIARRKRDYLSSVFILRNVLENTKGVKVEHRPIQYGENLSKYDIILLGLSDFTSVSCIRAFHALWATKYKHLCFVNDWKVKPAFTNCNMSGLYREYTFRRTASYYTDEQRAFFKKNKKTIAELVNNVATTSTVLAPCFNFGNRDILRKQTELTTVYSYDPTPFLITGSLPPISTSILKQKKKKWICGALYNYEKRVSKWGLKWPVEYFYNKNYIPEEELVNNYKHAMGVISPGYYNAGSGWYRLRFIHALQTNSVLLASEKEVEQLGDSYVNAHEVESKDDNGICKIVREQRESFMSFVKTQEHERKKILGAIHSTLDGGK